MSCQLGMNSLTLDNFKTVLGLSLRYLLPIPIYWTRPIQHIALGVYNFCQSYACQENFLDLFSGMRHELRASVYKASLRKSMVKLEVFLAYDKFKPIQRNSWAASQQYQITEVTPGAKRYVR